MAVDYTLALDTPSGLGALADFLVRNCGMQAHAEQERLWVDADGITSHLVAQSDLGRELILEVFGILSTARITSRLDKFDLYDAGSDRLVRMCAGFLEHFDCDLVLLANGEQGLILRRTGHVVIDCGQEFWRTRWTTALNALEIPFATGNLPSL